MKTLVFGVMTLFISTAVGAKTKPPKPARRSTATFSVNRGWKTAGSDEERSNLACTDSTATVAIYNSPEGRSFSTNPEVIGHCQTTVQSTGEKLSVEVRATGQMILDGNYTAYSVAFAVNRQRQSLVTQVVRPSTEICFSMSGTNPTKGNTVLGLNVCLQP